MPLLDHFHAPLKPSCVPLELEAIYLRTCQESRIPLHSK